MHIPEHYLSPSTCVVMGAIMIPVWKKCLDEVKNVLSHNKLPLLEFCSAFSFLVMMFNIPLPGGTTGHAVGSVLSSILIGPHAACISITIVLLIQSIFFGDGGILALGANCFNMAFVMPFLGYYIYKYIKHNIKSSKSEYIAAFISSYIAIVIAAFLTALELGIQPILFKDISGLPLYCPYSLSTSIPAMVIPHMAVAGFLEAIITTVVYIYVKKILSNNIYKGYNLNTKSIYVFITFIITACPIGLLASGDAWGEWGVEEIKYVISNGKVLGFTPLGMKNGYKFNAIIPDYLISGINENIAYVISAALGVLLILLTFKFTSIAFNKSLCKIKNRV
ncbi:fused nickel transport protein NikMN [Clostridium acetireducens DSM 10703]|jgi:cobalt/nickel transport system permease protein|uniref:Fused nickel transport protein NikMN n=1 Tax=Clostridium acetireducens DSM 10703 TaxID=1121290 RepID=A0A1E8F136_9CLOT|nr:cobalt transporter CbiM [Clostridium acetireducens]OFI07032.1 fused nickel transport protein NikMN [Clostridium acetireducens DSM 10703]